MSAEGLAFVDTNVLVYAFDPTEPGKGPVARELLGRLMERDQLRVSTQVLQELFVTLTKKLSKPCSPGEALGVLEDLAAWPLVVVDLDLIRTAVEIAGSAGISFWDGLIVAAAVRAGASVVYTEDLNNGQEISGVRIVNPFINIETGEQS